MAGYLLIVAALLAVTAAVVVGVCCWPAIWPAISRSPRRCSVLRAEAADPKRSEFALID